MTDLTARIDSDFRYHPPTREMVEMMAGIRERCRLLAMEIVQYVPPGREQSLALTNLEQASMWANAGIARHGQH